MARTVFVYESITGGGLLRAPRHPVPEGLLLKLGGAMVTALAQDFARIADVQVTTMVDARLSEFEPSQNIRRVTNAAEHDQQLQRIAASADATFLIAPELDGELLRIHDLATSAGGNVIGPSREVIRWAADKNLTEEKLRAAGIPTPRGVDLTSPTNEFSGPLIVKRVDGAGSEDMRKCDSIADAKAFVSGSDAPHKFRVESFHPGVAASVALLLGPNQTLTMPTCLQYLSSDRLFQYEGGLVLTSDPDEDSLQSRAQRLANRVAELLTDCTGYVGIDMVIGKTESDDHVIEVNPRLSTSYVGLRAATDDNLAEWMLHLADGTGSKPTTKPKTLLFPHAPCDFQVN